MLLDPCQRKWVADARNHRIQVFGAEGDFVGELACFGELGVFGIALTDVHASGEPAATLFATASPTSGGGTGTVYLFEVPMDCSEPRAIGSCTPVTRWDIELPQTGQTALLHAVTTEPDGSAIYISLLGGPLPPQKWVRVPVGASEE